MSTKKFRDTRDGLVHVRVFESTDSLRVTMCEFIAGQNQVEPDMSLTYLTKYGRDELVDVGRDETATCITCAANDGLEEQLLNKRSNS